MTGGIFEYELDRESAKPLYLQIYDRLYHLVATGELKPGERVPAELELAERFGIGRVTVRRAFDDLVNERLLIRRRGKGTFVAEGKIERQLVDVDSFTARMQALGQEASAQLLHVERIPATRAVSKRLAVEVETPTISITRLRLANGKPVAIETSTLSLERFPSFDERDFESISLYQVLREEYGSRPERSVKTLEITTAAPDEAGPLEVAMGAPLFLLMATVYEGDTPLEHVKTLLRGDRFRFRIGG